MKTKIFGVLAVAIMLAVALAPLTYAGGDAETSHDGWEMDPVSEEVAYEMASQIYGQLPEGWTEEDLENAIVQYGAQYGAIDPISAAYVLGILTGLTIAAFIYVAFHSESASDPGSVVAYEQEMLARSIESQLATAERIITKLLPNDASMLRYTSTYWERAVEYTIANPNVWDKDKTLNVEDVLQKAGVRSAINDYMHTWQKAIANEILGVSMEQTTNIAAQDCYDGMTLSFNWSGGSLIQSDPSADHWLYGDFKSAVHTTTSSSTVYLDVPTEQTNGVNGTFANTLYLYSPNDTNATMTPISGGSTITLSPGYNQVSGYTPGLYRLNTSGVIYAGDFSYSTESNPADLQTCLVMSDGDGQFAFALYGSGSDNVVVYQNGVQRTTSTLKMSVTSLDASDSSSKTTRSVDLINLIKNYQSLLAASQYVITECIKDARVTWSIFDACEASNSYVHPSTIMTALQNSSMSEQNILVNYYTAMKELSLYYEKYGEDIGNMGIEADPSVTDVLVFGDIYCNGECVVKGAIMTPSVFVSSETFKVGESHVVEQQMICTIWQMGASAIDDFTAFSSTISKIPVATLDAGHVIEVKAIKYKGEHVSEHTLEVPPIVYIPDPIPEPTPVPTPIKVIDADILVVIILFELAIIMFLLGYIQGDPVMGFVIAVIIFIVGFFFSGTISALALGTFEWPWWWPF